MTNENKPTALRSLGLGALIGCGLVVLLWAVAGAAPAVRYSAIPADPSPMPRTNPVILAVESQRVMVGTALVAPGDTNPVTLTVRTASPVSVAAVSPVMKRGTLSLGWSRSPSLGITGYRLYYGTNSGQYYASALVGNVTNVTLTGLDEGARYFIAAVAISPTGAESAVSNEASTVTPIFIGIQSLPQISAYGLLGRTNRLQMSTNLTTWETIHEWRGSGVAINVIHTNQTRASFRVEALP